MLKNKAILILITSSSLFILNGCKVDGKITGGGHMDSATASGKANFGFNASRCDDVVKGNLTYHDKNADVKIRGDVTDAGLCDSANGDINDLNCATYCFDGEHAVEFDYTSTNPNSRGSGFGIACIRDGGEGSNQGTIADSFFISLFDGPFAGYTNSQTSIGGNLQNHSCPGGGA